MKKFKKRTRSMGIAFLFAFWLWPALGLAMDNGDCLECHNDEGLTREQRRGSLFVDAAQFYDSAHHGQGIMCTDCHADIEELNYDNDVPHAKNLGPVACSSCHEEEQDAFANSVHTQISSKGITMTCYACHDYHYATPLAAASVAQRDNNFCAKCHNPYQSHDWLPKKEEHFAFVECTVCHVPEVQRHIHLKFFDLVTNQFYKGEDILAILGIGSDQFMPMIDTDHDGTISRPEFEVLELMLRQKNVHAIFHAELVAEMAPVAHQVKRGMAERNCEKCHTAESPYFEAVSIVLTKEDGGVDHHQVDRAVLKSYSLSHFYLYAGTRVKLLDMIGILLIGGAGCGVLGHLALRIVTIRGRCQKKEKS